MAITRLGFKMSFGLPYRVLSLPWVNRNTAVLCMKGKDFSSSAPVRYIPKKSHKVFESENTLPLKGSENDERVSSWDSNELRIVATENGRGLGNIFSDAKAQSQTGMCKVNALLGDTNQGLEEEINLDFAVRDHKCLKDPVEVVEEILLSERKDICEQGVLQTGKTIQDAENSAIKLLATRAFTAVELRKKLHGKRFSADIIEGVISNFQNRGLINDSLYAESFSRSRWSSSSWGPRLIKQTLLKKGVSEAVADKAIKLVFEDSESSGDQESKHGLSKLSMDQLYIQASKQWLRGKDVSKETRKSRIMRWLQYRGFNWGVTNFILKKLESQYAP